MDYPETNVSRKWHFTNFLHYLPRTPSYDPAFLDLVDTFLQVQVNAITRVMPESAIFSDDWASLGNETYTVAGMSGAISLLGVAILPPGTDSSSSEFGKGTVAGIVVGCVIVISLAVAAGVWVFCKRRHRQLRDDAQAQARPTDLLLGPYGEEDGKGISSSSISVLPVSTSPSCSVTLFPFDWPMAD
jgi:hypothetical protein